MAEYACRKCGATDSFASSEDTRTVNFIYRIEDLDGHPSVVPTSESDTTTLGDPHQNLMYECSACGSATPDLKDLIRPEPEPEDYLSNPELHHYVRTAVTMLGVGYAHHDDAVIIRALEDLGTMLGICEEFAAGVHHGMLEQGLLNCAAVPSVRH